MQRAEPGLPEGTPRLLCLTLPPPPPQDGAKPNGWLSNLASSVCSELEIQASLQAGALQTSPAAPTLPRRSSLAQMVGQTGKAETCPSHTTELQRGVRQESAAPLRHCHELPQNGVGPCGSAMPMRTRHSGTRGPLVGLLGGRGHKRRGRLYSTWPFSMPPWGRGKKCPGGPTFVNNP